MPFRHGQALLMLGELAGHAGPHEANAHASSFLMLGAARRVLLPLLHMYPWLTWQGCLSDLAAVLLNVMVDEMFRCRRGLHAVPDWLCQLGSLLIRCAGMMASRNARIVITGRRRVITGASQGDYRVQRTRTLAQYSYRSLRCADQMRGTLTMAPPIFRKGPQLA